MNVTPETPWLGLRSFTEEVEDYFYGRTRELDDLYERVEHRPLTILFGQSGLGKTSLLRAGLIPQLKKAGYAPVLIRLHYEEDAPPLEQQVLQALKSISPNLQLPTGKSVSLWEVFHDPHYGFLSGDAPRPVLMFDQFEEIFTLGRAEQRKSDALAFRDALTALVENRPPPELRAQIEEDDELADRYDFQSRPCKVLLSLREDFLHLLERWRSHMPSLMDNRLELRLLNGEQALAAVVEPGTKRPGQPPIVSAETGEAIVRFVAGVGAEVPMSQIDAVPPLLSLICAELNAQRFAADGTVLQASIEPSQLQGRSEDILQRYYNDCFAPHPDALRHFVEDRLLSGDGTVRESATEETALREMEKAGLKHHEGEKAIEALLNQRLLVAEERGGARRLELTHDVLTGVARLSRDQRYEREREAKAKEAELAAQKQRNRLLRLVAAFGLLALTSVVAAVLAFNAWQQAKADRERAVAAEQSAVDQKQIAEANQTLAEESLQRVKRREFDELVARRRYPEAQATLSLASSMGKVKDREWLQMSLPKPLFKHLGRTAVTGNKPVKTMAASPGGRFVAMMLHDGEVRVLDESKNQIATLDVPKPDGAVSWLPPTESPAPPERKFRAMTFRPGSSFNPYHLLVVTPSNQLVVLDLEKNTVVSTQPVAAQASASNQASSSASGTDGSAPTNPADDRKGSTSKEDQSGAAKPDAKSPVITFLTAMAFTPDGETLYAISGKELLSWSGADLKPGKPVTLTNNVNINYDQFLVQELAVGQEWIGFTTATLFGVVSPVSGNVSTTSVGAPMQHRPMLAMPQSDRFKCESVEPEAGCMAFSKNQSGFDRSFTSLDSELTSLAMHPDGRLVVGGCADGTLAVVEGSSRGEQVLQAHVNAITACAFRADGKVLYTSSNSGEFCIWALDDLTHEELTLRSMGDHGISGALAEDGSLALASDFGALVANEQTITHKRSLDYDFSYRVFFSPDGSLMAGYRFVNSKGEAGGWIAVMEVRTGKLLLEVAGEAPNYTSQTLVFSTDNKWFGRIRGSGAVEVHSLTKTDQVFKLPRSRRHTLTCITFSPDGSTVAIGYEQEAADFWRFQSDGTKVTSTSFFFQGAGQLSYSLDGTKLYMGGNSGDLLIWDVASKKLSQFSTGETTRYTSLAALPEGKIACGFQNGKVGIWNTGQTQPLCVLRTAQDDPAAALSFDDGMMRLLATYRNNPPQLWSARAETPELATILATAGKSAERYEIRLSTATTSLPVNVPKFETHVAHFWREYAAMDGRNPAPMQAAWDALLNMPDYTKSLPEATYLAMDAFLKSSGKLEASEQFDLQRFFNVDRRFTMRKLRGVVDTVYAPEGTLHSLNNRNTARRRIFLQLLTHLYELRSTSDRLLKARLPLQLKQDLADYYRYDERDSWEKNLLAGIVSEREQEMIYNQTLNPFRISREARGKVAETMTDDTEATIRQMVKQSLELDPRGVIAPLALGELEAKLGHPDLAEKAYRDSLTKARIMDPYDSEWISLGIAGYILEQGATDENWAKFKELVESTLKTVHTRNAFDAHQIAAKHAANAGKTTFAASLYEVAANYATDTQAGQSLDAQIERAKLLMSAGQEEAALSQMKTALDKAGLTSAQLRDKGIKLYNAGNGYFDFRLSMLYLSSAIALDPKDAEAYKYRAFATFNREQYLESISDYLEAAKLEPNNKYHLYNAARSYTFLGRFKEAAAEIDKAGQEYSDDVSYWVYRYRAAIRRNLGQLQEAADDLSHAIELIEKAIAKAADDTEKKKNQQDLYVYRYERAQIWMRQGRQSDVLAELKTLGEIDPKATTPLLMLAQVMDAAGHPKEEVQAAYQKVKPAGGWLSDTSRARSALGELDDAWKELVDSLLNGRLDTHRLYIPGRWMDYAVYFAHKHRVEQSRLTADQSTEATTPKSAGHAEAALLCLAQAVKAGFGEGDLLKHDYSFKPLWDDERFKLLVRALSRDAGLPMRHYELALFYAQLAAQMKDFNYDFQSGPIPLQKFIFPAQKDDVKAEQLRKSAPLTAAQKTELERVLVEDGIAAIVAAFKNGLGDIDLVVNEPLLAPLRDLPHWGDKVARGLGLKSYEAAVAVGKEGLLDGRVFGSATAALRPGNEMGWEEHALSPFAQWWSFYESNAMLAQWAKQYRLKRKEDEVLIYWSDDALKVMWQDDYLHLAKINAVLSDSSLPINGYHPGEIQMMFEIQLGRYANAIQAFQRVRDEPYPEGASSMSSLALYQIGRLMLSSLYLPSEDGTTAELDAYLSDVMLGTDWWEGWGRTNFLAFADAYMALEKWSQAEAALDLGLKEYPTEALLLEAKGQLLQRRGKDAERIAMFDSALAKIKKDDATNRSSLLASHAYLHLAAGKIDDAKRAAISVLALPKYANAAGRLARLILDQTNDDDISYYKNQIAREPATSSLIALARIYAQRAIAQKKDSIAESIELWRAHYMLGRLAALGWRNLFVLTHDPFLRPLFEKREATGEAAFYHKTDLPTLLKELFALPLAKVEERRALGAMISSRLLAHPAMFEQEPGLMLECAVLALEDARSMPVTESPSDSARRLAADPYFSQIKGIKTPLLTAEVNAAKKPGIALVNTFLQQKFLNPRATGLVEWPSARPDEDLNALAAEGKTLTWPELLTTLADDGKLGWTAASGDPSDRRHATRYYVAAGLQVQGAPVSVVFSVARDLSDDPQLIAVIADGYPYADQGARRKLLSLWREARADSVQKARGLLEKAKDAAAAKTSSEAVALYEKAFAELPPEANALYEYVLKLMNAKGDKTKAVEWLADLIKTQIWNTNALRYASWSYINLGMNTEALETLNLANRLTSHAGLEAGEDQLIAISIAQINTGDKAAAVASFKRAIALDEKWSRKETIENLTWPEVEKKPLRELQTAVLAEKE